MVSFQKIIRLVSSGLKGPPALDGWGQGPWGGGPWGGDTNSVSIGANALTKRAVLVRPVVNTNNQVHATAPAPVIARTSARPVPTVVTTNSANAQVPAPVLSRTRSIPAPIVTTGTGSDTQFIAAPYSQFMALPVTGTPWTNLYNFANVTIPAVDLVDNTSNTATRTLANALVYARTGNATFRNKVIAKLDTLPSATLSGAETLAICRQLAGYAIAADFCSYRPTALINWFDMMRTRRNDGNSTWWSVDHTSKVSANNWGGWSYASIAAIDAYLRDTADLDLLADRIRGVCGDRSTYAGFVHSLDADESRGGDESWFHDKANWVPINPVGFGGYSGICGEDAARSVYPYPTYNNDSTMYTWEYIGGVALAMRILKNNGYPNVYNWGDSALLRAAQKMESLAGQFTGAYPPEFSPSGYIPWEIKNAYNYTFSPTLNTVTTNGKQFGFTDWLVV